MKPTTQRFRTLTLLTVGAIFLLMTVGGIVRVTGSGLGCPDWPLCYGRVLPPIEVTAWIEFSHRVVAGVTGLLILATSFIVWRSYRHIRPLFIMSIAIIVLLVMQVPLGGVIVFTELEPVVVATHLAKAFLIFAASITIAVLAHRHSDENIQLPRIEVSPGYVRLLGAGAVAAFVLLMTGALVVGSRASYACPDWPLCHGAILPPADANFRIVIQMVHRYTVGVVSLLIGAIVWVTLRRSPQLPGGKLFAYGLAGALIWQIIVGAIQVLTTLHPVWRAMHLSMATAVWGLLVALTATAVIFGVVRSARHAESDSAVAVVSPGK